jgi:hypothetical protein
VKGYGREQSWPNLRYYSNAWVEELTETIKTLWSPGQDLNLGPVEYEASLSHNVRWF